MAALVMSFSICWWCWERLMHPTPYALFFIIVGGVCSLIAASCIGILFIKFIGLNPDHDVRPIPVVVLKENNDKADEEKPNYEDRYLRL
jgi:hypothetical protein